MEKADSKKEWIFFFLRLHPFLKNVILATKCPTKNQRLAFQQIARMYASPTYKEKFDTAVYSAEVEFLLNNRLYWDCFKWRKIGKLWEVIFFLATTDSFHRNIFWFWQIYFFRPKPKNGLSVGKINRTLRWGQKLVPDLELTRLRPPTSWGLGSIGSMPDFSFRSYCNS